MGTSIVHYEFDNASTLVWISVLLLGAIGLYFIVRHLDDIVASFKVGLMVLAIIILIVAVLAAWDPRLRHGLGMTIAAEQPAPMQTLAPVPAEWYTAHPQRLPTRPVIEELWDLQGRER